MSDLTEFLLERIAEQEAAARAGGHGWLEVSDYILREPRPDAPVAFTEARVLAECAAKRQIVTEFDASARLALAQPRGSYDEGITTGLLAALHALALPYADHPAFDPEWAL